MTTRTIHALFLALYLFLAGVNAINAVRFDEPVYWAFVACCLLFAGAKVLRLQEVE